MFTVSGYFTSKVNMSSFSDNNLAKKLNELNGTQQSIQTLSLWLIHHRKHAKTIVQVWLRELKKGMQVHMEPLTLLFFCLYSDLLVTCVIS